MTRLFENIFEKIVAFGRHLHKNLGICLGMRGFYKDFLRTFSEKLRLFQGLQGFSNVFLIVLM
jgi:hypothetical protein